MLSNRIDVLTLGESMLRLSPPERQRLEAAPTLELHSGGAESNVAIALARLGQRSAWWSRLPDNPLGRKVASSIRAHGVDTSGVKWASGRLGTYFVEFAAPPRPTLVLYDRAHSAASQMQPDDFDWSILQHVHFLHLTGITPALSASCHATVQTAMQQARAAGVQITLDLNYRAKLWSPAEAAATLDALAAQADWVIAAERDIQTLFNWSGQPTTLLPELAARWHGAQVVLTSSAQGAYGYANGTYAAAPAFSVTNPIQIGAGDAFAAGLLCALLEAQPLEQALRFANAVAALKLTQPGDVALVTRAEVEALLASRTSAVQR